MAGALIASRAKLLCHRGGHETLRAARHRNPLGHALDLVFCFCREAQKQYPRCFCVSGMRFARSSPSLLAAALSGCVHRSCLLSLFSLRVTFPRASPYSFPFCVFLRGQTSANPSLTSIFANTLIDIATEDRSVVGITAAMPGMETPFSLTRISEYVISCMAVCGSRTKSLILTAGCKIWLSGCATGKKGKCTTNRKRLISCTF